MKSSNKFNIPFVKNEGWFSFNKNRIEHFYCYKHRMIDNILFGIKLFKLGK